MIHVINETNTQLYIQAFSENAETVEGKFLSLCLVTEDGRKLSIIRVDYRDPLYNTILEKYGEAEKIKNRKSRFNFYVDNMRPYIGVAFTNPYSLYYRSLDMEEYTQTERYVYTKDIVVVIHTSDDTVDINNNIHLHNVLESPIRSNDGADFCMSIFPIKWYNWSKLKKDVGIMINGTMAYKLGTSKSGERIFNTVKGLLIPTNNNDIKENHN